MTVQRMKWLLLGAPGIVLLAWMTLALQTRKVDDNALKNAAKGDGVADLRPELLRAAA